MLKSNKVLGALRNVNLHGWFVTPPSSAMVQTLVTAVRPTISTVASVMAPHQRSFTSQVTTVGSSSASNFGSPMASFRRLMSAGSGDKVDGLTDDQADGMRRGLSREEVIGLNKYQILALCDLRSRGLRAEHLRGCGAWFNSHAHIDALRYLMKKRYLIQGMNASDAVSELISLTWAQVYGISQGLSRNQIVGLNDYQVWALREQGCRGLKAEHLRGRDGFNSCYHPSALKRLMDDGANPEDAVAELDGLTMVQAKGVSRGLRCAEVVGFNDHQVWALCDLYDRGLRAEHLRGCGAWFNSYLHERALENLMEKGMNAEEAMAEIDGLTKDQAWKVSQGTSRKMVLSEGSLSVFECVEVGEKHGADSGPKKQIRR